MNIDRPAVPPERLALERKRALELMREANVYLAADGDSDLFDVEAGFTCDKCELAPTCTLAFDLYNTDGDCLASK